MKVAFSLHVVLQSVVCVYYQTVTRLVIFCKSMCSVLLIVCKALMHCCVVQAIIEGVVVEYKDIYKDAVEKSLQCVTDVPYFEGDFWPNVLEESIRVRNYLHSLSATLLMPVIPSYCCCVNGDRNNH